MTTSELMAKLESLGTAQTRKIYINHGVKSALFGVSYADLKLLKKQLGTNHKLALELWQASNHDARMLALRLADPGQVSEATLNAFAGELDNYILADALSSLVAKSSYAKHKVETWTASQKDFVAQVGWNVLSSLALADHKLPDSFFTAYIDTIASSLHSRKNRTRHAMNQALIAMGVRSPDLHKRALASAATIGKVEVDHGPTGCKTPDAATYIRKTLDRKGYVLNVTT